MITTPVTVVGLGSMGRALADAFFAAGHPTTVWNRSPAKAAPLVARGAAHHESIAAAVAASPLVIACLTTYDATLESLAPADLAGRTLVTLNSGTPADAREMAAWTAARGARFLDGAVKNVGVLLPANPTRCCTTRATPRRSPRTSRRCGSWAATRCTSARTSTWRRCTRRPSAARCFPRCWASSRAPRW